MDPMHYNHGVFPNCGARRHTPSPKFCCSERLRGAQGTHRAGVCSCHGQGTVPLMTELFGAMPRIRIVELEGTTGVS